MWRTISAASDFPQVMTAPHHVDAGEAGGTGMGVGMKMHKQV